jgi:transcriptional regulator with XRE-family HTH domain
MSAQPDWYTESFADRLWQFKKETGLPREQIAALLSISDRTMSDWMRAKTEPLLVAQEGALARLAKYLAHKTEVV